MDKLRGWMILISATLLFTCLACLAIPLTEHEKQLESLPSQNERVKRVILDDGDDNDYERCTYALQSSMNPSTKSASPSPINLMDLLNNGSRYMADVVEDAVLIMGNKGSGTTTIAEILAKDIDDQHVYISGTGRLVTLVAKTKTEKQPRNALVPQLVMEKGQDTENATAFYGCPEFDSSRTPEVDIAVNYFMRQLLLRKVSRVKILFLVPYTSMTGWNNFKNLDLLVSQAAKLLVNIPNYQNSIALVITQVHAVDWNGHSVPSEDIINTSVKWMTDYLAGIQPTQTYQVAVAEFKRKSGFVETLLEQNESGQYNRISFMKSPLECGPLNRSKEIREGRERISKLYSEKLEYAPIIPNDNFASGLSDQSKLILRSAFVPINEDIATAVSGLMSNFTDSFLQHHLQSLKRATKAFGNMLTTWEGLEANSTRGPKALGTLLASTLEAFDYPVKVQFKEFMELQQHYLEFEYWANPPGIIRFPKYWISPVELTRQKLVHLVELQNQRQEIDSVWAVTMELAMSKRNKNKALEFAIDKGYLEALKITIHLGANVNSEFNSRDDNALTKAACVPDKQVALQMIKLLIEKGAVPSHKTVFGDTFLHYCRNNPATPTQFHQLVKYVVSQNLTLLFDSVDTYKITPLMTQVENIEVEMQTLSLLKENGVNFQAVDHTNNNLLYYAVKGDRSTNLLTNLIKLGVDWKQGIDLGMSSVHYGAMTGNLKVLQYFVELGADVNERNKYGNTPLHYAATYDEEKEEDNLKVIRYLIGKGANVKARNDDGDTPWNKAMRNERPASVIELLRNRR